MLSIAAQVSRGLLTLRFPDLMEDLRAVIARVVDLKPIVKRNYHHPDMCGSWSLKGVLPTVVPELDYGDLDEVHEGTEAEVAYEEAIGPRPQPSAARADPPRPARLLRARHAGDGAAGPVLPGRLSAGADSEVTLRSPTKATCGVDGSWANPHTVGEGGMFMTRSYKDIVADRSARIAPESAAQPEVLERAYDIAQQVIDLREKHGLTQRQLAERCGIDQGDISRIERGSTSPTARTLQRIAEVLDADVRLVARAS